MRVPPRTRTFVTTEPSAKLAAVVEQLAPGDVRAIEQGRVFVDRQRVKDPLHQLAQGAQVTWYGQRPAELSDSDVPFSIISKRGDWAIATKPATWVCEPDRTGVSTSLRDAVAAELRAREVHVVTRLDVGVSGLVLLALSHRACSLAAQVQSRHEISKQYLGVVTGSLPASATWNGPPCGSRDARTEVHSLAACNIKDSQGDPGMISLLNFKPITGRKHQIRIHASHYGVPLLGDARYGGATCLVRENGAVVTVRRIMLHAYRLDIPWENEIWSTACAVPPDFVELWTGFGGDAVSLNLE